MSSNDAQMAQFVAMSVILTGFEASVIAPGLDPIDLKKQYLDVLNTYDAALTAQLLAEFVELASKGLTNQQIADALVETTAGTNPSPVGALARAVILLWYLGSFYPPNKPGSSQVVSANAYIGGLAWRVAQSKAMGYSEYSFGYWASPPLALSGLIDPNQRGGGHG